MSEYLTVQEVADLLRTTPTALYSARHRGIEPASLAVQVGKRLLWRRADLEKWFDRQIDKAAAS